MKDLIINKNIKNMNPQSSNLNKHKAISKE